MAAGGIHDFFNEIFNPSSERNVSQIDTTRILETNPISNPISFDDTEKCILRNTKKINYYKHTYNPTGELANLRRIQTILNLPEEVFAKFDDTIRHDCCNVISVTLYLTECVKNLKFYIVGIYRTVKNVRKNLPDWIVRLYFDNSVYTCFNQLNDETYLRIFNEIISSPNVELYTFNCENDVDLTIPVKEPEAYIDEYGIYISPEVPIDNLGRKRTQRFLPMMDPTVNICVIRESDGFVSNFDCHNIKAFALSNKIFYISPLREMYIRIDRYGAVNYDKYAIGTKTNVSYASHLISYKYIIDSGFFNYHQNIYDLLAGTFGLKLKLRPEYYSGAIRSLNDKIFKFLSKDSEFMSTIKYSDSPDYETRRDAFMKRRDYYEMSRTEFNINFMRGYDEILLLYIFKEIISIPLKGEIEGVLDVDIDTINLIRDSLFMAENIPTINIETPEIIFSKKELLMEFFEKIIRQLKDNNILKHDFHLTHELILPRKLQDLILLVDALILRNENINEAFKQPFNILFSHTQATEFSPLSPAELINYNYNYMYDEFYDSPQTGGYDKYKIKYLKYKQKYMDMKKQLNHNN